MGRANPSAFSAHIDELLAAADWHDMKLGRKTAVVVCTLASGFEITGTASCLDPDAYDHDRGVAIARARVRDRLFELEGYHAQSLAYEEGQR